MMYLLMAVVNENAYRRSVQAFADNFADLVGASVELVVTTRGEAENEASPGNTPRGGFDAMVERAEDDAEAEFERADRGPETPHEAHALRGPPIEECIRKLAACDLGVVGKTLEGELEGGRSLGRDVEKLKQAATRPLTIVPETVNPISKALFIYTDHPEAGHALEFAGPLAAAGVDVLLLSAIAPLGRPELVRTGAAYLEAHGIGFTAIDIDTTEHHSTAGGPAATALKVAEEEKADLIVMGGTHRGPVGRLLWTEMAHEIAWNADIPVLIWY